MGAEARRRQRIISLAFPFATSGWTRTHAVVAVHPTSTGQYRGYGNRYRERQHRVDRLRGQDQRET